MVEIAGVTLELVKGGTGEPLLILHDVLGHRGWLRYHEALAQHCTLYIPSHPGFGKSERLDWVLHVRDLAGWYLDALDDSGSGSCAGHRPGVGGLAGGQHGEHVPASVQKTCSGRRLRH